MGDIAIIWGYQHTNNAIGQSQRATFCPETIGHKHRLINGDEK